MADRHILWNGAAVNGTTRAKVYDWLIANGINPDPIPMNSVIAVQDSQIQYCVFATGDSGRPMLAPGGDDIMIENRTAPLLAPYPGEQQ